MKPEPTPGIPHRLIFTAAVTAASKALILRDRLLGRVKKFQLDEKRCQVISSLRIASGSQVLDAVFVRPTAESARAALLICHGIGETVDHGLAVQKRASQNAVSQ
jgi:uncharacterized protein